MEAEQKLRDGSWPLLQRDAQGLCESALPPLHARQLTTLELRWLRSLCDDARAPLFLTDAQMNHLRDALADVPPIFEAGEIESFDAIRSGDDFADPNYPPFRNGSIVDGGNECLRLWTCVQSHKPFGPPHTITFSAVCACTRSNGAAFT